TFVRKQLETSGQYLEPVTSVWSKVVSIAEGLYARFSAAAVFVGPYKAGSFFFVDTCNKNLDTFGDNHYYAQKVDTMHSLIKRIVVARTSLDQGVNAEFSRLNWNQIDQGKTFFKPGINDGKVLHDVFLSKRRTSIRTAATRFSCRKV
ncbi:hypothetical protein HID58_011856, partial [Brassica napus]